MPRTLRTRRKEAKNTSARCGVPFRYAPCASPALIRLLQCAPEESKITFLAEFEILHQCPSGWSLERPITERRHRPEPQKACQSVGTQDHHSAARRRANEKNAAIACRLFQFAARCWNIGCVPPSRPVRIGTVDVPRKFLRVLPIKKRILNRYPVNQLDFITAKASDVGKVGRSGRAPLSYPRAGP